MPPLSAELEEQEEQEDEANSSLHHPFDMAESTNPHSVNETAAVTATAAQALGAQQTKKKSLLGTTTARKKMKKKATVRIKLGCQVFPTHKALCLWARLSKESRIQAPPPNFKLHGSVVSGKGTCGCNDACDLFPAGQKSAPGILRN